MIARAPGKVVVSGAYAVLEGAPAVVVAVDRYATADTSRAPDLVTPEVAVALGDEPPPWFDASPLREGGRKLGLGSSAAILVASLAALELEARGPLADETLGALVFERALRAHRAAQGGGTGIDVAASCHGGTIVAERRGGLLTVTRAALPAQLHLEIWKAGQPASTPALLARVEELRSRAPERHRELLDAQGSAARAGAQALRNDHAADLVAALDAQCVCLERLGTASGVAIVTESVRTLRTVASREGATVLPSGAGGGDIALFAGLCPPTPELRALATREGLTRLELEQEARGVHHVDPDDDPSN